MLETLQELDKELFLNLNSIHSPYWDTFMSIYTGKLIWIPMYASILYVLWRNFNWRTVISTTIAFALVITLADQTCSSILRPLFERPRPSHNQEIADIVHLINGRRGGMYGFPSCHASNTFALTFFILWFFRNKALSVFFILWAVITCYSRIYVGVHYPGDLLFGMVVGITAGSIVYLLYRFALHCTRVREFVRNERDCYLIEHPGGIKYTLSIIYTGLITIFAFGIYALFV